LTTISPSNVSPSVSILSTKRVRISQLISASLRCKCNKLHPAIPTTIQTIGVNITTIAYLRVLIIGIGSTISLMVVEARGTLSMLKRLHPSARLLVVSNKIELAEWCTEVGCEFMLFPCHGQVRDGWFGWIWESTCSSMYEYVWSICHKI